MRLIFFYLLLITFPIIGFNQTVSISGNASFFANEKIEVFHFKNRVTNEKELITSTIIHKNGSYLISFDLDRPQLIGLKIEMRELLIPVHPNSNLALDFLPIKNADNQRVSLAYDLNYSQTKQGLASDSVYEKLQNDFANLQLKLSSRSVILEYYSPFFEVADSTYQPFYQNDALFNTYYTYFKANAFLHTPTSKSWLIQSYLNKSDIQYNSREYLKFFNGIMLPRVNQAFVKNRKEFETSIKEFKIYSSLLNLLKTDSNLKSEEIRSLALLNYVKSNSSNTLLNSELKGAIIGQMANFCQFPIQKEAARYFQQSKKKLVVNSEAPLFELKDQYGQILSLKSYRGKPVYLGFINSKSRSCYQDLQTIERMRKKFKKAEFFMVLTDRDSVDLKKLPDEGSNFNYVFLNKEYKLLETYEIWSYPVYFLLDKHGYLLESPAKRPSEMFSVFEKMFAKKPRGKRYEIIND